MEAKDEVLATREGSGRKSRELTIKYSKELSKAPYTIDIDHREMRRVLTDFGVDVNETGKIEVNVLRKPPINPLIPNADYENTLGSYIFGSNEIEVYADNVWGKYESLVEVCDEVLEGSKDPGVIDKFRRDGILVTGRLSEYLAKAPPQRARKFLGKLALIGFERNMKIALLHETAHKSFDEGSLNMLKRVSGQFMEKAMPAIFFTAPLLVLWERLLNGGSPWETVPAMVSTFFLYSLGQHLAYKLSPEEMTSRKLSEKFTQYPNLIKVAPRHARPFR